jgi:hypothetical protein
VIVASGAAVAALVPLGSSSVLAASSSHVSASTLLRNACKASFSAPAFRVQGHITQGGTPMSLDISFGSAGELVKVTQKGDQTVNAIVSGPSTYFKANRSFWQANTGSSAAASQFAGRWIDMTSDKKDATSFTKDLNKKTLFSQCGAVGSATYTGNAVLNGVKAYKVHEGGYTGYIENGPTPYILRVTAGPGQKNSGDLVFSNYGVQPDTTPPSGAIPISQLS